MSTTIKSGPLNYDIPALMHAYKTATGGPNNFDIVKFMLHNANVDWSQIANINPKGISPDHHPGPSVLSRIFDILLRPTYASAETARQIVSKPEPGQDTFSQGFDIAAGTVAGLTGKKKTTYSQVIKTANPEWAKKHDFATGALGFAGDILLDPTTYVGVGALKSVFKPIAKALGVVGKEAPIEAAGVLSKIKGSEQGLINPNTGLLNLATSTAGGKIPGLKLGAAELAPTAKIPSLPKNMAGSLSNAAVKADINLPSVVEKLPLDVAGINAQQAAKSSTRSLMQQIKNLASPLEHGTYQEIVSGRAVGKEGNVRGLKGLSKTELVDTLTKLQEETGAKALATNTDKIAREAADISREFQKFKANPLPTKKTLEQFAKSRGASKEVLERLAAPVAKLDAKTIQVATERAAAVKAADKYVENVLSKPNRFSEKAHTYNPAQQANFFQNKLLAGEKSAAVEIMRGAGIRKPHAPVFVKKRFAVAFRLLKEAEQHLESRGITPSFWDGSSIKLSEVIDAVGGPMAINKELYTQLMTVFKNKTGFDKITNPKIRDAIQQLRTKSAVTDAPLARLALNQANVSKSVAEQVLSGPKYTEFLKGLAENQKKQLALQGMSKTGVKSTVNLTREIINRNKILPQAVTSAHKISIARYMVPGQKTYKWAPTGLAQTRAISQSLGASMPKVLGTQIGAANKAVEFFGAHLATWYGQRDLRPEALIKIASAMNNASLRSRLWNDVAKNYGPEEINAAFKTAQGVPGLSADSELVGKFQKTLEDLFAAAGLKSEAQAASTVAYRSGMLLNDINKQLKVAKSTFKFTNAAKVEHPVTGVIHDFSKDSDWLKSWVVAETDDPLAFMMKVETATEQLMHQYDFMDEMAARFGSATRTGPFHTPVATSELAKNGRLKVTGQGRLLGVYFSKDIAEQINNVFKTWSQIYDPKSPMIRFVDKVTSSWKSGVTIYAPSHHVRNFIGDAYLSWMAGVNNPAVYATARRVVSAYRNNYRTFGTINNLAGKDSLQKALTRPGQRVLRTKAGIDLTAEQVYVAAHKTGLLSTAKVLEDIIGDPLIKFKPFGGHVQHFAQSAAELREHYVRIAHFVDALKKSPETNLTRLFNDASKQVRKWHPDGMDLTKFERETMRRVAPFYSWTRKAIPLVIEGALTNPKKVTAYPKALYNIQIAAGIDAPSPSDPFPTDQLFPSWLREKGIGPVLGSAASGYSVINPSNPLNDLVAQFGGSGNFRDPISGAGQMLNPMLKIPAELTTGSTMLGVPLDYDPARYATEQVPILSNLSRLGNMDISGSTERGDKQGMPNWPGIINFLTALGLTPTAPYIKQAQFEQKEAARRRQ